LAVKLEAAEACGDLVEEGVKAAGEVGGLFLEDDEAVGVAAAVCLGGGFAVGFNAGVEDAKGEDGEAVDDEARGFGVERGGGVLTGEVVQEPEIDLFDQVIATLVEAVDSAFDTGDIGVGGLGVTGLVFFVPEVEVFTMLGGNEGEKLAGGRGLRSVGLVPGDGEVVMKASDGCGFKHAGR